MNTVDLVNVYYYAHYSN
uniref:Uncharacterized protein n=1 Tax=Lepeophtheirus salmonis TaxID=72036 RepID=A0A0K2URI9_LEPSM